MRRDELLSQGALSDPLRQQTIRTYADSLAIGAQSARITDVEALARVSSFAAALGTDPGIFIDDIGLTLARTTRANAATPLDNNIPAFGDRGFYSLFRDGGNQVRHFTGAFVAGVLWAGSAARSRAAVMVMRKPSVLSSCTST